MMGAPSDRYAAQGLMHVKPVLLIKDDTSDDLSRRTNKSGTLSQSASLVRRSDASAGFELHDREAQTRRRLEDLCRMAPMCTWEEMFAALQMSALRWPPSLASSEGSRLSLSG